MSFDSTNQKIGLLEAAANNFLIRDQLTNDHLDLSESNFKSSNEKTAKIAVYLLQALCQAYTNTNHHFNSNYLHFPSLKDEPFTRDKLRIIN